MPAIIGRAGAALSCSCTWAMRAIGGVERAPFLRSAHRHTKAASRRPSPVSAPPTSPLSAAPDFKGTAVVDGELKTVSLSDYKGK